MTSTVTADVREAWGDKLRLARLERRDSQDTTATALGMNRATVAKAEAGQGSVDTYERLARHYGLTLTIGGEA